MTYAYNSVTHKLDTVTAGGTAYNYSYDANGNITACPKLEGASSISATLAIAYNVDNMPTQVVKSESGQPDVTTNFYYDGNGARVRKEVVGEGTTFYASQYYEVKNGVATKYIFGADRRIAKITDGEGIQYFSKDHLGSSTVVTDDSGAVVEQADYRPFGEDRFYTGTVATPTPYKYTDQELDESTGLYNYDARHYDPAIGRFISPDSLIPNLYDPQQLNPYAYCRNNPLIYVDPSGHYTVGDIDASHDACLGFFGGSVDDIGRLSSLWSNNRTEEAYTSTNTNLSKPLVLVSTLEQTRPMWQAASAFGVADLIGIAARSVLPQAVGLAVQPHLEEYAEKNKHGGLQGWVFGPLESYLFGDKAKEAQNQTTETIAQEATQEKTDDIGVYHRIKSDTQTFVDAMMIQKTGELWGGIPHNGKNTDIPCVKAYTGPLLEGQIGIEFTTSVKPDSYHPNTAYWSAGNPGVQVRGGYAVINVTVTKNTHSILDY
ncbi:RHS repeat-associated core domain-containing protein [Desulfatibacillum aliphaticivorans]|nr:RHS repeat-associated core domain-containing protein [Desulfatibacillum aliphaticivorans]